MERIVRFSIRLTVLLAISFAIHNAILNVLGKVIFDKMLILAYVVNTILAILIFAALCFLEEKMKDQLGFLFLGGGIVKIVVFFVFFSPLYNLDGELSKPEVLSFFVPYIIALVLETLAVVKILNSEEKIK